MAQAQRHEMVLEMIHPSGMEEWYCPLCGRRELVMNLHPAGRRILISEGDERAHARAAQDNFSQQRVGHLSDLSAEEQRRLLIWADWFDEVNSDSWSDR